MRSGEADKLDQPKLFPPIHPPVQSPIQIRPTHLSTQKQRGRVRKRVAVNTRNLLPTQPGWVD